MMTDTLIDCIEDMVRQSRPAQLVTRDYMGQVAGTMVTNSGAISCYADALYVLSEAGRFRILVAMDRMVVGYWPENDPEKIKTTSATSLTP